MSAASLTALFPPALPALIDSLPAAIILLDSQWRITYANQMARRISRISESDLNSRTLSQIYPDIVGTDLERLYREAVQTNEPRRAPAFFYEPFKTWFDLHLLPTRDGVAVFYTDVTSLHDAEAARVRSNEHLTQVLEAITDAVVVLDRNWTITYLNERARKIVAPSGEVLGTNHWQSFPSSIYEGSPFVANYYPAMERGIPAEFETFYGEPLNIWVQCIVHPDTAGIIVFFRDITARKRADAALIQSEKLAAVGRLASSIAHEINNPLESVTNLLYLARLSVTDPEIQKLLDLADLELRRVSIITNQTLRFHKQSTAARAIGCSDLFGDVLTMYEGKLRNSGITVQKRKRAHLPVVCFEGEIRQVLSNFFGNAIDAMPTGGRLLIRSREGTDWRTGRPGIYLTVADTGTGMDPKILHRVFEAFFTTKGFNGTGLGLWISDEIVRRHNGRILIRTSQNPHLHGTTISLFLPYNCNPIPGDPIPA